MPYNTQTHRSAILQFNSLTGVGILDRENCDDTEIWEHSNELSDSLERKTKERGVLNEG